MFTRFNGNVVPFADDATSTNRTVFGGVTQSDAIDDNLNADFKKGWEIVGLNDNPTREDFNAMGYTLGALISYLYQMGIAEWNDKQKYKKYSRVTGSDGKIYKALTGTTGIPNVGNNPTTDAVNWQVENVTDYSILANKATPVDADLIAIADSTSSFSLKKLTWANIKTTIISSFGVMISTLTAKTTPVDADIFTIGDSAATNASKKLTWANIKTALDATWAANDSRVKTALNASGTAPIYACRAWVNFNGTGTVAIRASGNVSSITDNGTGDYTVNFTTAMPDANYATSGMVGDFVSTVSDVDMGPIYGAGSALNTSSFRFRTAIDGTTVSMAIFR